MTSLICMTRFASRRAVHCPSARWRSARPSADRCAPRRTEAASKCTRGGPAARVAAGRVTPHSCAAYRQTSPKSSASWPQALELVRRMGSVQDEGSCEMESRGIAGAGARRSEGGSAAGCAAACVEWMTSSRTWWRCSKASRSGRSSGVSNGPSAVGRSSGESSGRWRSVLTASTGVPASLAAPGGVPAAIRAACAARAWWERTRGGSGSGLGGDGESGCVCGVAGAEAEVEADAEAARSFGGHSKLIASLGLD